MKMKVGIGTVSYIQNKEQLPELRRMLNSVMPFDHVIIVDGKWNDIDGDGENSIPEALEMMKEYDNVTLIMSPNQPEAYNRNKYFLKSMELDIDFLLMVDTDEWVELPQGIDFAINGVEELFADTDYTTCEIHGIENNGAHSKNIKGVLYPGLTRHKHQHNKWFIGQRDVRNDRLRKAPRGIITHHDKSFRLTGQKEQMIKRAKENPIH